MFTNKSRRSARAKERDSGDTKKKRSEEWAPSILGSSLRVNGNLFSEGDIHIEGRVEGDIRTQDLTVGHGARVHGNIFADHIRVAGTVYGDITARVVELFATAHVLGNVAHETLAIEAGAHIEGLCKRGEIVPLLEAPPAEKTEDNALRPSGGRRRA